MEELKTSIDESAASYAEEIKCIVGKADAENNEIKLKIRYKDIEDEGMLQNCERYHSWYLWKRVKDAFRIISWYMSDDLVDIIWKGIGQVTVTVSEEPNKHDSKKSEVKKIKDGLGKLKLYLPLGLYSYQMCFTEAELVTLIQVAAFTYQPDEKMKLLQALSREWRVRWGYMDNFSATLDMDMFWQAKGDADEIEECKKKLEHGEKFVKGYKVKYIQKAGFAKESYLILTNRNYYTFDGGDKLQHKLSDIICLDLLPSKKGELSLRVYTNEPEPEPPIDMSKCKGVKCKVKIPKPPMPDMPDLPDMPDMPSLPDIDMPSFPTIDLPDMPEMPEMFKIDISNPFKREKKVIPPRYHPDVKEKNYSIFIAVRESGKDDKKAFLEELAWATYAAQCGAKHTSQFEVYYDDYPGSENAKATQELPPTAGCTIL